MNANQSQLDYLQRTLGQFDAALDSALPLNVHAIDQVLGGGLARGALHELSPAFPTHAGAATGFALALAVLSQSANVLWIQNAFARFEGGAAYGLGMECLGLPMHRLLRLELARADDVLWAAEEALKRHGLSVIAELFDDADATDLTAMRRLSLAARTGGGLGLLLRHRISSAPSAAVTRWEIASAAGTPDRFGGLGRTRFALTLSKNRYGPCGSFVLTWNHHECAFESLSLGVAEAAGDRSARPLLRRTA